MTEYELVDAIATYWSNMVIFFTVYLALLSGAQGTPTRNQFR